MADAIGQVLSFAVVVALSPVPIIGALLVPLAAQQWRARPRGDGPAELPKWMRTVDTFAAGRAVAVGVALSALNPKNLPLTIGAAAAIAQAGLSTGDEILAMAVFVLIGTLGPGVPVVISLVMGERAARVLDELKEWMGAHNAAIMAVLCLVIGVKLIGDGISGLG
jgi:threonine/homoserine/homoserine lactone efflux protein